MESISPLDLLEADPRPTCVVDLLQVVRDTALSVHARNKALRGKPQLVQDALYNDFSNDDDAEQRRGRAVLRAWASDTSQGAPESTSIELLDGHHVYGYTVAKRWRIIQWQPTGRGVKRCACEVAPAVEDTPLAPLSAHELPQKEAFRDDLADRIDATEKLASMATIIEMIDVGFYEYDLEGKLIQGNDAFYKLSGHPKVASRSELPPLSFADCVYDEDRDKVFAHWALLSQGISTTFEMRWKRPATSNSGRERDFEESEGLWVLAACVPTRDKDGVMTSIVGCITDINAQKRSQRDAVQRVEALERAYASEKRFGRFCESTNVGIVIVDTNIKVQFCNREWFDLLGHPVCEFEAIDWSLCVDPEDLADVQYNCESVVRTKQPAKFSYRIRRAWANGHGGTGPAWLMACAYPELNEDGSIRGVAATIMDISYLKWAESVQKQRTDEALEAKRQQENFIDFTCHEVRNPLSAVIHCADLIESALKGMADVLGPAVSHMPVSPRQCFDELYDDIAEAVTTIMSCSTHQKRIMDDILTLSKLDSKLLTISPSPVRLNVILRDAEKMFEADAKKAGVTWRVVDDSDGMLDLDWVMLDTGRLMQVLINLITNALKFTQNEAVRNVTLSMRASRHRLSERELSVEFVPVSTTQERQTHQNGSTGQEVYIYFVVSDTGCGFSDEQKTKIFERFTQASPRTHSKYGGSGLGLFITRELIELQGGAIGVSSRLGEGATFAFYVTARAVSASLTEGAEVPVAKSRQPSADLPRATYNILVVEDNLVNQKVLRKQLEKLGHRIHVVSHGVEALSFLETTSCWAGNTTSPIHVSVILMDVEMPVMDGITCARRIREAQARGDIPGRLPIIAVSANARYEQIDQAIAAGMDDAISKPFRIVELIPKIQRLVTAAQISEDG